MFLGLGMRKIPCPCSEEFLRDLVEKQHLSDVVVASVLPLGTAKRVRAWREDFGILPVGRWNHSEFPAVSGGLRSLLLGSMLGDGRLVRRVHVTHYSERHCEKQLPYLDWKAGLWGDWARPIREIPDKRGHRTFGFNTWARPELNEWHDLFYASKKGWKQLGNKLVDMVDPFALAIWYLDDGSAGWWPGITFGMDPSSRQVAFQIFEKFGLIPRWQFHKRNTGNFHFEREDTALRFLEVIRPYVPDCMQSKMTGFGFQGPHYQVRKLLTQDVLQEAAAKGTPIRVLSRKLGVGEATIRRRLVALQIQYPRKVGRPRSARSTPVVSPA